MVGAFFGGGALNAVNAIAEDFETAEVLMCFDVWAVTIIKGVLLW
jgi:hypothetical protein